MARTSIRKSIPVVKEVLLWKVLVSESALQLLGSQHAEHKSLSQSNGVDQSTAE